jgi:methylmalonyl-CoA/ethylmalonyl-CoA epimerase
VPIVFSFLRAKYATMILKIEHLGFAVADAESALVTFEKLLGRKSDKSEVVETEKVRTHFFNVGESKIELLESLDPEGVISRFIEKKGSGMHHVAFLTDDIQTEILRLKEEGFEFLGEPKEGADNKKICFLHPKSTNGVLVELCQEK